MRHLNNEDVANTFVLIVPIARAKRRRLCFLRKFNGFPLSEELTDEQRAAFKHNPGIKRSLDGCLQDCRSRAIASVNPDAETKGAGT